MNAITLRGIDDPVRDLPTAIKETGKSPLTDLEQAMLAELRAIYSRHGYASTYDLIQRAEVRGR